MFQSDLTIDESKLTDPMNENAATFVTLTIDGELRGCIGKLEPTCELFRDVSENAVSSAFYDPRFPQITEDELKKIKIEISILSKPEELKYKNSNELLKYLDENKPGVILKMGISKATFLPQVWEEIGNPKEFLSHLCVKAGLDKNSWMKDNVQIEIYQVFKFSEN